MAFLPNFSPDAQPGEVRTLSFPFASVLASGESLTGTPSAAITVYDGYDSGVGGLIIGSPSISGADVLVTVGLPSASGLQPGVTYEITTRVLTTAGQQLELTSHLRVTDVDMPNLSTGGGVIPASEFSVTTSITPGLPGTYYLQASGLTITMPAGSIGGDFTLVDLTGAPSMTLGGVAPLNMPAGMVWTAPYFNQRFHYSVLNSSWVLL